MHVDLRVAIVAVALLATSGCFSKDKKAEAACQKPGQALAAALDGEAIHFEGPHAIGGKGDYVLQNDHAAYVIQGVDRGISYYHYGGILVDAVAMNGCDQATPDQFDEVGLMLGELVIDDFAASTLRAFRAVTVEVLNDGSDGEPAIIRATGVDDYYWLIEYTLIAEVAKSGGKKLLTQPYGIEIQVDYVLQPNSPVLEIRYTLINKSEGVKKFMAGAILTYGDQTEEFRYASGSLDFGGYGFSTGVPWVVARASDHRGAYAFTISDANVGAATISGVNAVFDFNQTLSPLQLRKIDEQETVTFLFSVGKHDAHSAIAPLTAYKDAFGDDLKAALSPLSATVVDAVSGQAVSNAVVDLELESDGTWFLLDSYVSNAAGLIGPTRLSFVNQTFDYRLAPHTPERGRLAVHELASAAASFDVTIGEPGYLAYDIKDQDGRALPAKITMYQGAAQKVHEFVWGQGLLPVPPGVYEISITRGFEYRTYQGWVTVPAGSQAEVSVSLEHVLDTSGYLSIDTHVHSGPSADSKVPLAVRIANAAAEGLEVPVATDHEAIVGLRAGIEATGLHEWVNTITGEEVTATLPEHLTMFPVVPDGTLRGGIIKWYKLGLPELWTAMHERSGGGVNILNHPSSIYSLLEWDRIAGDAGIEDYSRLQMIESAKPWSWDFEGVEVMNGYGQIFRTSPEQTHAIHFDNWMSFHNHGKRIAAVGCSDSHGLYDLGAPRSYFASPTDKPKEFKDSYAVESFKKLDILVSGGAFARILGVNGQAVAMGDTISDEDGVIDLKLDITALPEIDVTHFRVYANCDEVTKVTTTDPHALEKFNGDITVPVTLSGPTKDAHIVVAGFGANQMPRGLWPYDPQNVPRFLTNPIYIDVNGDGDFDPPGGKECSYTLD